MREVRVGRDDGRQTAVLTSREDLSVSAVAYRIFSRRRRPLLQYMKEVPFWQAPVE